MGFIDSVGRWVVSRFETWTLSHGRKKNLFFFLWVLVSKKEDRKTGARGKDEAFPLRERDERVCCLYLLG